MFVVKIGGSILFDEENQINDKLISKYAKTIRNVINDTEKKCTIIVGGGKLARKYIAITRKFGASEETSDIIGIESAKLNARLLISALGDSAYPTPPNNLEEFQEFFKQTKKVIVCGGFKPGQSTNAVAASIAEITNAEKLINLTNVEGVYSDDPGKNPEAKLLEKITIAELETMMSKHQIKAGYYPLFDPAAIQIVKRSKIPLQFASGHNPENLTKIISGAKIGTSVIF
ncbi:MAG: UMP kinase [Candidatus Heimdallarchaeota archaeon]|nr:UMP kinase [Candidatus Heimdallarchaeota archaeon]